MKAECLFMEFMFNTKHNINLVTLTLLKWVITETKLEDN